VVGGHSRWDMALHSRYCRERFVYTSPFESVSRFRMDVRRAARRYRAGMVLPTSEAAMLTWFGEPDRNGVGLQHPVSADVLELFSKRRTYDLAEKAGVRVPRTVFVDRQSPSLAGLHDVSLPAVVKADASAYIQRDRVVRADSTTYVRSADELETEVMRRLDKGSDVLVQELISGYGVGVSGVFRGGAPVALFQHRRMRESTPTGGPSALAVSTPIDKGLRAMTEALVSQTGYTGPAMIEFKISQSTGQAYLMEVNWRLWGTILLPMSAGLDMPYILWRMLNGLDVDPASLRYSSGIVGRYLVGDTKHLILSLRGRPSGWSGEFPTRCQAARDYLHTFVQPGVHELLLARDDPMPFCARVMQVSLGPLGGP